ncbi:hypothetical protein ACFWG7_28030 [Streptomyces koyangensis]|uniref:hypothetical protein n=1 Tax=Streptomyces koyangensis TaxID=188770 RepID=UPI003656B170
MPGRGGRRRRGPQRLGYAQPAFAPVQQGAQTDAEADRATRDRLRALRRDHGDRVTVLSAHDPWEFARLTTPTPLPAPARPGD